MPDGKRQFGERLLCLIVTIALMGLIFVQVWLYLGRIQPTGSWYGAELAAPPAEPVSAFNDKPYGVMTWELADYSRLEQAQILRNGYPAASFTEPELSLRVYDGDVFTFDATAYPKPVRIRLKKLSANIDGAFLLTDVEVCGGRVELGRTVFK